MEKSKELSSVQIKVLEALRQPGAYMMPPQDLYGKRTGYVTTGGLAGWICPVKLSTFNILLKSSLITVDSGIYRINRYPEEVDSQPK